MSDFRAESLVLWATDAKLGIDGLCNSRETGCADAEHVRAGDFNFESDPWWKSWIMWIGRTTEHIILDDRDAKQIFQNKRAGGVFEDCVKTGLLKKAASEFLGFEHGIFLADGKTWLESRKSLSKMFSARSLRSRLGPALDAKTSILTTRFLGREEDSMDGRVLDLGDTFRQLTLDLIAGYAFGIDINCLEDGKLPAFVTAFDSLHRNAYERSRSLMVALGINSKMENYGIIKSQDDELNAIVKKEVFDAWYAEEDGGSPMREAADSSSRQAGLNPEQAERLAFQYMKTMLLAGADTTSIAMTWLAVELFHQDTLDEGLIRDLRDEALLDADADTILRSTPSPLLEACILETLRLHPPIPKEVRIYRGDLPHTLPSGIILHRGDLVRYDPQTKGRSENHWDSPLEFRPGRWLNRKMKGYEMPVFNIGRRECLGIAMAMSEIRYVFTRILKTGAHNFRFTTPRRDLCHDTRGFVTRPAAKIEVYVLNGQ